MLLPWECVQETHLPRMGYVKNDDGTPLGYRGESSRTQGSSLREQPWALIRNSVGVEDIANSDQCQISSYQVLRTVEIIGVAIAAPLMEIPILACKNASQRCPSGRRVRPPPLRIRGNRTLRQRLPQKQSTSTGRLGMSKKQLFQRFHFRKMIETRVGHLRVSQIQYFQMPEVLQQT